MDRQLLERLIGAGVLVLCLVIVAPAILDGPAQGPVATPTQTLTNDGETRRVHTIRLNERPATPPVAREVSAPPSQPEPVEPPPKAADNQPGQIDRSQAPPAPEPAPEPEPRKAKAADQPPPKPASVPPQQRPGWAVQLGSFSSRDNAQQLADRVGDSGFPVFLSSVDRSGKKLYRVRVGPLKSRPQAEELAGRLSRAGYTGQVTPQ